MEKNNHFVEMPFYHNSDRLTDIEKEITKTIKEESRDYLSLAVPFWRRFWRVFRVPSIQTYYQREKNRLIDELHSKTQSIQANVEEFQNVRYNYVDLTAKPTDKNYLLFVQTEQARQQRSHAIFMNDNTAQLVNGSRNEAYVLSEQQRLHIQQIRHIKSENAVEQARNNTIGTQLESCNNNDLLEKGSENGVNTWARHQDNDSQKEETDVDASFSQSELHRTTDSEASPTEINTPKVKPTTEKSQFTPLEANDQPKAFPYRNDLPPYVNGEWQFTNALDYFGRAYASLHFPKECPENDIDCEQSDSSSPNNLDLPNVKQNMLGGASLVFTVFLFLICVGVMLYEGSLFQQVLTELFQLTGYKIWFAFFIPIVISEAVAILQYGLVKKMIKRETLNWRGVTTSRYFICLLIALFCISSTLGVLYYKSLSQKQEIKELSILASDISKLQNQKMLDDNFEDQEKLDNLQKEYEQQRKAVFKKSPFMEAVKMTLLALVSGILILATSLCLSYTMLSFKSCFLHRKISRLRKQNTRLFSRTLQIRTTLSTLREKGYYITSLRGKRLFIRSLKNGGVPASAIYSPETSDEYPLPLDQTSKAV